ncbi:MAG: hypothetical protein QW738_07750 [Nitrososphaeria archaeon]
MAEVSLIHIIGTAIIIFLVISTGYYVVNTALSLEADSSAHTLKEITERVSTEIVSLLSLSSIVNTNTLIFKTLTLPSNVNGKGYTIEIKMVEDASDIRVIAWLDTMPNVKAESQTHISKYGNVELPKPEDEFFKVKFNNEDAKLLVGTRMPSGSSNLVVWCRVSGDKITIGLGKIVGG